MISDKSDSWLRKLGALILFLVLILEQEIILMNKEGELISAENELGKFKEQIENAAATKSKAVSDLKKANITLQSLMTELRAATASKQFVSEATEALKIKIQAKQLEVESTRSLENTDAWQEELDQATELYKIIITKLDLEKQELTNIRQDFDASLEAKLAAVEQEQEAQRAAKINTVRIEELSKEIAKMRESLAHVKLPSQQSQRELQKIMKEKDALLQSHGRAMEEVQNKKFSLKKEIDPELTCDLEMMLVEIEREIAILREELQKARALDMDSVRQITLELEDSTKELRGVVEEESSLRRLVDSLKLELETLKEHISQLQEKEAGRESIAESMNGEQEKSKSEIEEEVVSQETDAADDPRDLFLTLAQISSDSKKALMEAEEIKKTAEMMKQDAQTARNLIEEGERKLALALQEVEEAKAAEKIALDEIAILSKRAKAARASQSMSGGKIPLSVEEYESLSRKVEVSENLGKMKEAAAIAHAEAVNASKNEVDKKVKASLKEIQDIRAEVEEATKAAEVAEEEKMAMAEELLKLQNEIEDSEDSTTSSATHPWQS